MFEGSSSQPDDGARMRPVDMTLLSQLVSTYHGPRGVRQQANIRMVGLYLPPALTRYAITTLLRQAHFLAQVCEESWGMSDLKEEEDGSEYEGRKSLGNTQTGDGARFKGRGLIQLTGRANYIKVGKELNLNLVDRPDLAETADVAVNTACQFWTDRHLNRLADLDDLKSITHKVNGKHLRGLKERARYLALAKKLLGSAGQATDVVLPVGGDVNGNPIYAA